VFFFHEINPLLINLVRSRWLDIGLVHFLLELLPSHLEPMLGQYNILQLSAQWPLDGSEAEGDLVLIKTSPLLLYKSNEKSREVCIKARSPSALLAVD